MFFVIFLEFFFKTNVDMVLSASNTSPISKILSLIERKLRISALFWWHSRPSTLRKKGFYDRFEILLIFWETNDRMDCFQTIFNRKNDILAFCTVFFKLKDNWFFLIFYFRLCPKIFLPDPINHLRT